MTPLHESRFSAYLFDMDGTLIDTEVLYVESTQHAMARLGFPITHEEAVAMTYGKSWNLVHAEIQRRFPAFSHKPQILLEAIQEFYYPLKASTDIRIPSSITLLQSLAQTAPVAIVSGSTREEVDAGIARMEIAPYLQFSLSKDDFHLSKPDPAGYRMAAERLNLPPEACLVFEDSTVGVQAAKGAGMPCVALQRPGFPPQDFCLADWILSDLQEFPLPVDAPAGLMPGL
ncbi:MAG: HAD family phosphatase [bacterium]|jgi:HAD superfamily hydrolase (TIGR01509 family)|nr:HAD family phosphatase [bacterium]